MDGNYQWDGSSVCGNYNNPYKLATTVMYLQSSEQMMKSKVTNPRVERGELQEGKHAELA